jgi:hypothetical protein
MLRAVQSKKFSGVYLAFLGGAASSSLLYPLSLLLLPP